MSHLSSTMQNIAASEEPEAGPIEPSMADPPFAAPAGPVFVGPVPGLGETVIYHSHEWRSGAREFAAIVTKVHRDDAGNPSGLLDMVVVFDADDFMGQRGVRPWVDSSGWTPVERSGDALAEIDKLSARMSEVVLGSYLPPAVSIMQQLVDLQARCAALEAAIATPVPAPAKNSKRK
ncbi:MAG: hypothetical protein WC670_18385 [Pseudolabrys sp.]|jgi:hypothetical protein